MSTGEKVHRELKIVSDAPVPLSLRIIAYLYIVIGCVGILNGGILLVLMGLGLLALRRLAYWYSLFLALLLLLTALLSLVMSFGSQHIVLAGLWELETLPERFAVIIPMTGLAAWHFFELARFRTQQLFADAKFLPEKPLLPRRFSVGHLLLAMALVSIVFAQLALSSQPRTNVRIQPYSNNGAMPFDCVAFGYLEGRLWNRRNELTYVVFEHFDRVRKSAVRTRGSKAWLDLGDGEEIDLFENPKLYECRDGKWTEYDEQVSYDEVREYLRTNPPWTAKGLVEFVEKLRRQAK